MERAYHNDFLRNVTENNKKQENEVLHKLNAALTNIKDELQEHANRNKYLEKLAVFGILVPWVMIIPFAWLPVRKGVGLLLIPTGILALTGIFAGWSVRRAKRKHWRLIGDSTAAIRENAFRESRIRFGFTKREVEVIGHLKQGETYPQIADRLFISTKTVKSHVTHIFEKAGVHNKTELIYKLEFREEKG